MRAARRRSCPHCEPPVPGRQSAVGGLRAPAARPVPCPAPSAGRSASGGGAPVSVRGFHAPDAASASLSSTASGRRVSRPGSRPAPGARFLLRPAWFAGRAVGRDLLCGADRWCARPEPPSGPGRSAVVVGDNPGELTVVGAKCQAQPAQLGRPLCPEATGEPVDAWPEPPEHDGRPGVVHPYGTDRVEWRVHPYVPSITRLAGISYFGWGEPPYTGRTLTNRHIFCTSTVTNRLHGGYPLGAESALWTTIGKRNHK